jgi:type IV/VI secretion system ImpK/VasF family protein
MKNDQWEAIQVVFEKMEQACGQLGSPVSPIHSPLPSAEVSTMVGEEEVSSAPDRDQGHDVVEARAEIRTQLDFLRVKLAETLAERDCYLVLFPIVAYFDEHVQTRYLDENQLSWPPLQKELFQIDDAGELFYETVDDLLRKPQTIPFIYEVYYFCLNQGFQGKYVDNPVKISEYMKKLREKIPVVDLSRVGSASEETGQIRLVGSAIWYYLASAAVLVLCYLLLLVLARNWDPGSGALEIERAKLSHQQGSIRTKTKTEALPERKGSAQEGIKDRRTIIVKPIYHTTEKPRVIWQEPTAASLKPELETPPQLFEETEVTPAAEREIVPQYSRALPYVYSVQVGSFKYGQNALFRMGELQRRGIDGWVDLDTKGGYHRVLVGRYEHRNEALAMLSRLRESEEFHDALQVKVEMEITPAPQRETVPQYSSTLPYVYSVQVSSFKYRKTALSHSQELRDRGLDGWVDLDTKGGYHRVLVGRYEHRKEALAMLSRLKESEEFHDALQVKVETSGSTEPAGTL